jgi:ABC-type Fe3+ transport system permease subunit
MAKLTWLIWGAFFSILTFALIYFVVYNRIVSGTAITFSSLGLFFSNIWNVILFSLILGLLLGLITGIEFKKKKV